MKKRRFVIYIILLLFLTISIHRIIELCIFNRAYYEEEYNRTLNRFVKGSSAPRGRILDVNGKILVDNIGINTVIYNRTESQNKSLEVEISYKLGEIIQFDENGFSTNKLKTFYLIQHDDGKNLITEEEYTLYNERKLNKSDLTALKYERITDEMLEEMSYEDKNAAHIYYILSNGYFYEDKVVKKGITDEEVVKINDMNLPGIRIDLTWERSYPYGNSLRTLLGGISTNGVPKEYKEYYEEKGISQNSTVGISFLEFQYDDYLRGKDAVYRIKRDGKLELSEKEEMGSDLYLSIDIDKQLELESILKTEMLNAKKAKNTQHYNHSYVIVGHPKTGEIVAALGLQIIDDHFVDITANMITMSYTVGSIVKGATISVGYQQNLIEEGKKVIDSCVKVYGVTQKCSWTSLGAVDDIRAIAQSSNYYQFMIAARLANPNYKWNAKLGATKEHFDIYRNMLASYGLGSITGIDLPNEQKGIIGKTVSDDLLLNLAIGQYDTYTPIEVFQYLNTIASGGIRIRPTLMKKIEKAGTLELERTTEVLETVDLSPEKIARVQKGLREVMVSGTGKYYADASIKGAGKTGTSETFIDTNGDGLIDTSTISTSYIMYAPFDNPEYSVVIISPNISTGGYKYGINQRVVKRVSDYLFGIS